MLQEELVFPKDYGLRYAVLSFLRKVGMSCSRTGFTNSKFSPPLFAYSGNDQSHTVCGGNITIQLSTWPQHERT